MADTPAEDLVLTEQRGPVLLLTFNRPERLNAWTDELESCYFTLLDAADDDPAVRAIVVTGAGRGFCAGADMDELKQIGIDQALQPRACPRSFPLTIRKPLIAAINGAAAGLGLVEALYCDLRFCTPSAKLTTAFVRRGLIAEYGISWLLPRIVGTSRALDLLMSGRVVLGDEALRLGLVDVVVEPEALVDAAVDYAQDLAAHCSPVSMSVIKTQLQRDLDVNLETSLADANRLMHESFGRDDFVEGVASYLEQRPCDFAPLSPKADRSGGLSHPRTARPPL